jgi:hypothetical protein
MLSEVFSVQQVQPEMPPMAFEIQAKTRKQRLCIAAAAFAAFAPTDTFRTPKFLENPDVEAMKATSTDNTVFEPIVDALNAAGEATPANNGGVMTALGMSQDVLHAVFCDCHHGGTISAGEAGSYLEYLGNKATD